MDIEEEVDSNIRPDERLKRRTKTIKAEINLLEGKFKLH